MLCSNIHLSAIRILTYLEGSTIDQRRAELRRHICIISARNGITHTGAVQWVVELSFHDRMAQAQASVREVHLPQIDFSMFKLIEQHVHGS